MNEPSPGHEFVWTRRRKCVSTLLALHWLMVLGFAIPWGGTDRPLFRFKLPLAFLNTHKGEVGIEVTGLSPIRAYGEICQTRQQWEMFTKVATPADSFRYGIGLEYRDGGRKLALMADRTELPRSQWFRRRLLERALRVPHHQSYVLGVAAAFARREAGGRPLRKASLVRLGVTRVLLVPDGTDAALFEGAEAHIEMSEDPARWTVLAEVEIPLERLR